MIYEGVRALVRNLHLEPRPSKTKSMRMVRALHLQDEEEYALS